MSSQYTYLDTYRYERKYTTFRDDKYIETSLKTHPAIFSEIYTKRYINNIYFDTSKLDFFYDNVGGKAKRYKFRIRWYGDLFGTINSPILEVKIKDGNVVTKNSFFLNSFELSNNYNINQILEVVNKSNVEERIKGMFNCLHPTLINRYNRKYFLDLSKNYRTTIDYNIEFYNPFLANFDKFKYIDNENVLELKYDQSLDKEAKIISDYLPYRLTKNSKYVKGIKKFYKIID